MLDLPQYLHCLTTRFTYVNLPLHSLPPPNLSADVYLLVSRLIVQAVGTALSDPEVWRCGKSSAGSLLK